MNEHNDILFREVQRFSLWLRLPLILLMLAVAVIAAFAMKFAVEPAGMALLSVRVLCGVGLPLAICALLMLARLETEVRPDGLYVRLFPFHVHYRKFSPADLHEHYARTYRPILEYGGWGIRLGRNGKAYNMTGKEGVQLVFKNGRRLLIGSQEHCRLADAISAMLKL